MQSHARKMRNLSIKYWPITAIVIALLATVLRILFLKSLGTRATFLIFYPSVMLAAILGGFRAGLLNAILSSLAADYFFISPFGTLFIYDDPADLLALAIFILSGIMISLIAELRNREHLRLISYQSNLEEIIKDRTKNIELEIIERKHTEEALNAYSLRQNAILEAVPDIIAEVDNNKVYTWMNKAGFEFFGADALGKEAAFYFEGQQNTYTTVKPLFEGDPNIIYLESWQRRKDGTKRLLAWWCRSLIDKNGKVIGVLSTARDITEIKLAEEAVRLSEMHLKAYFDSAADAIYVLDADTGKIRNCNKAACHALGYSIEEIMALPCNCIEVKLQKHEILNINQQAKSERLLTVEGVHKRKDGSTFPVEIRFSFLDNEHPQLLLAIVRDISERKHKEQQLELSNKEYQSFSYSVSHDLRNPLNNIVALSEMLNQLYYEKLDEDGKRCISEILKSTHRMSEIISDLLSLARATTHKIKHLKIDLAALAQEIIVDLQKQQPDREVQIIFKDDLQAYADVNLMKIALKNLLENAWKYTGKCEKPIIEFGAFFEQEKKIFYIKDNGAGFDMASAERIFQPFQRSHGSDYSGIGIGLAIVDRIIKRHNGKIWAKGERGKGAIFYFSI